MKTALLVTTAIIALTPGTVTGTPTRPTMAAHGVVIRPMKLAPGTLYNQNSSSNGQGVDSQIFTSGSASSYYAAGADDFVVARAATTTAVDVSGLFFNGAGPADGAYAVLYSGGKVPKTALARGTSTGRGPNFTVKLKYKLKPGKHYWISVVVNCSFTGGCGEWAWGTRSSANNDPAVWEYPAGGGYCTTWKPLGDCFSGEFENDDFLFDIRGK